MKMNDEAMNKFKLNDKYRFWVKGMLFMKDKCLLGLCTLEEDIKNECPFVPFALKNCDLKECQMFINECCSNEVLKDCVKKCMGKQQEGFNKDYVCCEKVQCGNEKCNLFFIGF
jgi:hypothetical protein